MQPRLALSLCLVTVFASTAGCDDPPPVDPTPSEPAEPPVVDEPEIADLPEPTPPQRLMHGHYRRASEAREALIRGDVEAARVEMQWLATHHEGDALPENLQPRLTAMQTDAAAFAEATTLTEAGQALSRTLVRCGECHQASGGGFHVALPPIPEGDTVVAHMQRHRWSAERMWEGLVTADVEQFNAGTEALREVPLHEHALPASEEQPPERVSALATHVHELGAEARDAADWPARANLYGRYLATCAACHRLLETGPDAPPQPVLEEE